MNFKIASLFLALALAGTASCSAEGDHDARGLRRRGRRGRGRRGDFVDITTICTPAAEDTCALRNGLDGVFVCSGDETKCIPTDKALSTDTCGCCGGTCPEEPAYQDLTCDADAQAAIDFEGRGRGRGRGRRNRDDDEDEAAVDTFVVCRVVENRRTGEEAPKTIRVPINRGLEGDICGCCDDDDSCSSA